MNLKFKKSLALAVCATALMSLTACGGKVESVLKDADLAVSEVNGDAMLSLMTELDTQNLVISAVSLPVANGLGVLEVLSDITTQKTYLKLSFKLGKALRMPNYSFQSTLPNGTMMPLAGISLSRMMAFDVGTKGSKVYLYYDATTKKSVVGVALNLEALSIGTPLTALGAFSLGNVTGVAGLYFGSKVNTSGLAIFADLSSVFTRLANEDVSVMAKSGVRFIEHTPNSKEIDRIDRKLYNLSTSKTPLKLK